MKTLLLTLCFVSVSFAQNTGGGGSGGGGGSVTVTNQPGTSDANNLINILTSTVADGTANTGGRLIAAGTNAAPLQTLQLWFNGLTWDRQFYCNATQAGTVTAVGATQILPLVAAKSYRICAFRVSTTPAVAVSLTQGTGTNCGTGTANLSLSLLGVTNVVLEPGATAAYKGTAANAVCITLGTAQTVNYDISYTNF